MLVSLLWMTWALQESKLEIIFKLMCISYYMNLHYSGVWSCQRVIISACRVPLKLLKLLLCKSPGVGTRCCSELVNVEGNCGFVFFFLFIYLFLDTPEMYINVFIKLPFEENLFLFYVVQEVQITTTHILP
ncbi:unnamed protein product [Camellia sinensis]